jgi:hypothetical protein
MSNSSSIDGVLVTWGDRLFFPGNRRVKSESPPRLRGLRGRGDAAWIRARIEGTVRRAPQVMVKVTGGGRGMKAIAAHFRYISKNGRLEIEDEQGNISRGKDAVRELTEDWRLGGSLIENESSRRGAFNIILSMPRGTDPLTVLRAAREFAQDELADHKYVMVLHDHQANPHVHVSVRAESKSGKRLNPRKADLHRWRETFAEKLRGWGIAAEATRQATRDARRSYPSLWQMKAMVDGRLKKVPPTWKKGSRAESNRAEARDAWAKVAASLAAATDPKDRLLAARIEQFLEPGRGFEQQKPILATAARVAKERGRDSAGR